MNFSKRLYVALLLVAACGCTNSVGQSPGPALKVSGDVHVAVPNAAMGKEYIMSTSVIPEAGSVTGRGLLGRVVIFVHMFAVLLETLVAPTLPS